MKIIKFLLSCGGADKEVLDEVSIETPKFVSIGAAILLTAVLASLSGGYAIYSSFNSVIAATLFGVLWGVVIFNIDRYIVISIDKNSPALRQMLMAVPRLIISFLLAITISKPLELRIFQGSINNKLYQHDSRELFQYDSLVSAKKMSLKKELAVVEKANEQKTDLILADYAGDKAALLKQQESVLKNIRNAEKDSIRKKILTSRLNSLNAQISSVEFLINKRKKQVYSGIEENENINADVKRKVYREFSVTDSLYPLQVQEIKDKQTNRDMLVRLKALADLKASDDTMNMTGNLITLLFILIEMSPVLIKLMSKKGLYEDAIQSRHNEFYLKQNSREEINKQNTEKLVEDNRRENDTSDYALKKKAELVKLKIDEWFGNYFS
jgi:hypothetical protein